MPVADISGEYRSDANQSKFPRLKLQMNEKARGFVASKPVVEYVHRLEAPNIVNMAPTYKKIKDKDGNEQFVIEKRFVAGPICQGDFNVLRERGVDDKGCQACLASRDRPDIFRPPFPKYAVNFLRYSLRPGGSWADIANPYGVSALVWVFGAKVMDKLIDIRAMGDSYQDIRMVDLCMEVNEPPVEFQKPYSNGGFTPVQPAVWMSNEQTRSYTAQYLASNGASNDDLLAAIGKRVKPDWMADDINRVIQRWDVVRAYESRGQGGPVINQPGFGGETLQQGMAHLQQQYGQVPPGPQGYAQQQGAGIDMGLLGGASPSFPPTPPPPAASAPSGATGAGAGSATPDYMVAAQQAAQQGQNPVAAAYEAAQRQENAGPASWNPLVASQGGNGWQAPGQLGDMFVPPTSAPTVAPAAPPETASTASGPGSVSPSSLPQGLDGLNEFMASRTSNPSMEAQPSVPHDQLAPPAATAAGGTSFADLAQASPATPPEMPKSGESYSFEDLARMGQQQ